LNKKGKGKTETASKISKGFFGFWKIFIFEMKFFRVLNLGLCGMRERKGTRMKGFDYSTSALYFITSITQNRIPQFGSIKDRRMILNQYGAIADNQWNWLGQHFPYVILHAFVVMPDHIHGIIEIDRTKKIIDNDFPNPGIDGDVRAGRDLPLQDNMVPRLKSISQLIGAYKTTVSKQIHLLGNTQFAWQRSFHDHIIRNHTEYERISNYIIRNPACWRT
jgi:hypothetical protein